MTTNGGNSSSDADAAINRVLEAERAAKREVAACRREALLILREARARSRALADRTDRRINRVHALSDAAIQRSLASIAIEEGAFSDTPRMTEALSQRLDTAIDGLIEETKHYLTEGVELSEVAGLKTRLQAAVDRRTDFTGFVEAQIVGDAAGTKFALGDLLKPADLLKAVTEAA